MILNRQRRVRVPVKDLGKFLARASRVLRLPPGSLTVCLVTDAEIARWNRGYRGKQGPTDVLSFPAVAKPSRGATKRKYESSLKRRGDFPVPRSSASYLGDIAIAPAVARRYARRFDRTFDEEMRILIVHGMLHLMGYDHETDTGQMDRRERRVRHRLGLA
ncbi:MAG TPA: rRNA maturation RNase YbeY [Candidatus Acidoferrales bacterium]|nr:rRNA maturation RNase YbeY [Candidatus Acidoferrales bacterium]